MSNDPIHNERYLNDDAYSAGYDKARDHADEKVAAIRSAIPEDFLHAAKDTAEAVRLLVEWANSTAKVCESAEDRARRAEQALGELFRAVGSVVFHTAEDGTTTVKSLDTFASLARAMADMSDRFPFVSRPPPAATETTRIDKPGRYVLTKAVRARNLTTIQTLPAGMEIEITQVDAAGGKVIGPELLDWTVWDLPVRPPVEPVCAACNAECGVPHTLGVGCALSSPMSRYGDGRCLCCLRKPDEPHTIDCRFKEKP